MTSYQYAPKTLSTLKNPPVVYAAVMVNFPMEKSLDEKIGGISDRLKDTFIRRADRIHKDIAVNVNFQGHELRENSSTEYVFSNDKNTLGFTLTQDKLFFHVSKYPKFLSLIHI